jgi:hypothetical protein
VLDGLQEVALEESVSDGVLLDALLLVNVLEGVELVGALVADYSDLSKGAFPY